MGELGFWEILIMVLCLLIGLSPAWFAFTKSTRVRWMLAIGWWVFGLLLVFGNLHGMGDPLLGWTGSIFFGIMCYDSEPNQIVSRLVRRDSFVESDRIDVILDSHHSRQNAFWFFVYPSGSVMDGAISGGDWWDSTWNGVWEVKTKIHRNGWAAELKIPYHVLRFAPKQKYIWGLQVARIISRKKEYAHWRL